MWCYLYIGHRFARRGAIPFGIWPDARRIIPRLTVATNITSDKKSPAGHWGRGAFVQTSVLFFPMLEYFRLLDRITVNGGQRSRGALPSQDFRWIKQSCPSFEKVRVGKRLFFRGHETNIQTDSNPSTQYLVLFHSWKSIPPVTNRLCQLQKECLRKSTQRRHPKSVETTWRWCFEPTHGFHGCEVS